MPNSRPPSQAPEERGPQPQASSRPPSQASRSRRRPPSVSQPSSDDSSSSRAASPTHRRKTRRKNRGNRLPAVGEDEDTMRQVEKSPQETAGNQVQKGDEKEDKPPLRLRLDLNLELEVSVKAKIHGDLELSLLDS